MQHCGRAAPDESFRGSAARWRGPCGPRPSSETLHTPICEPPRARPLTRDETPPYNRFSTALVTLQIQHTNSLTQITRRRRGSSLHPPHQYETCLFRSCALTRRSSSTGQLLAAPGSTHLTHLVFLLATMHSPVTAAQASRASTRQPRPTRHARRTRGARCARHAAALGAEPPSCPRAAPCAQARRRAPHGR